MYAAPKVVRVSSKVLHWHRRLSSPLWRVCAPFARYFRSVAQLQARNRPSPLVNIPREILPVIPKSLFPETTVYYVRNGFDNKRTGTPRFILIPTGAPDDPQPPITRLRPSSGMLCYVQIVNTPTADTPGGCLMLHFDNRRYLFGRMAEGTQRTMVQRKISLAKIHDIFLTGSVDWDATGGLLGMILTIADLKAASIADIQQLNEKLRNKGRKDTKSVVAHLNIHGGKNLVHLLATARRFILRKALPVYPREVRQDTRAGVDKKSEPDYEDENIRVWSIPLSNEPPTAPASEPRSPKKRKLSPSSESEPTAEESLTSEEADQSIREAVVKDMFNSQWKLDTLREMRLADVELPAKVFVRNDKGHIEPYAGPGPAEAPDTKVLVRLPWPAAKIEQLPRTRPSKQSMCYIVKCQPRRGKFNVDEANRLGVARTDFKKLTAGESVPGKDGAVVTPDMVIGTPIEGHGFAVVDLPSADLIPELLKRQEWSDPGIMQGVDNMYWILSNHITLEDPELRNFIKARPSVKHIVLGKAVCPNLLALESPASQIIKMNRIDEHRFPLPIYDTKELSSLGQDLEPVTEIGRAGLKFQLAPKPTFLTDALVPVMDTTKPIKELITLMPQVLHLAELARKSISERAFLAEVEQSQRDLPCPEAEIIPLGTGSAMPSKYRNVSATLLRVPGWGNYLLDCGENTLGQLRRCFGYQGADNIIRDLRAIYISHAHADHHLGTISIIARWREVVPTDDGCRLAIIATPKYQGFVREFHQVQELSPERLVPINLRPSTANNRPVPGTVSNPTYYDNHSYAEHTPYLPRVEACYVDHCFEATAAVFTFPDTGLKIAYSGDCRPSPAFAELGRGAHLLIHECTFDDDLSGDALAKKHSTLSEALDIGRQMRARRILLTHFSQRYPKLPVVSEEAVKAEEEAESKRDVEVLFAFDGMRVKLGEFKQAKMFLPALRELLDEAEKVDEKEE